MDAMPWYPIKVYHPLRKPLPHPQTPKVPKSEDEDAMETVSSVDTSLKMPRDSGLYHPIDLSPLVDVLFAHYVGVDEEVSVTYTEMLLTGGTFETFQVIHFVFHPHRHLIGTNPFVTGCAETVLPKKPEIVSPAELPAQFVVEAPPHLAQPAATEVAAQAVLVPVLVDGLQEVAVPDILLAAAACQQGRGDLQHLIHWFL